MPVPEKNTKGLLEILDLMGFKVEVIGEKIIAAKNNRYSASGQCVWVDDFEEILRPNMYGYSLKLKRWKIIFSPISIESSGSFLFRFLFALDIILFSSIIDLSKVKLSTDNRRMA